MKYKLFFFSVILFVAAFLRLFLLGSVPISMSDDEIREGMSAYSFAMSGKDLYAMSYPLSFNLDGFVFAPIPIYIVAFFIFLLGLSEFSVRVGYAIAGIVSVIGVYFLTKQIIQNRTISLLSMTAMSVSVWAIHVSRFAHQGIFSLAFLIWASYFFLKSERKKSRSLYISMALFFFAFYSYSAIKAVVIPVILVLLIYKFKQFSARQITAVFISIGLIVISFIILAKFLGAAQYSGGQFFFLDIEKAEMQVELSRRASEAPEILERIYHNKLTYWMSIFWNNYLYAFSPSYLFLNQEQSGIYSMWSRGQLYLVELPLIFLGALYLFIRKRKQFFVLIALLLIAPLPSGIGVGNPSYTMRAIFMIPLLYIFVASGIFSLSFFIKNKKFVKFLFALIFLCYIFAIGRYITQYYFEWSKANASYYSQTTKDMIKYAVGNQNNYNKVVIAESDSNTFLHYAFYEKIDIITIQKSMKSSNFEAGNIVFQKDCVSLPQLNNSNNILYILTMNCNKEIIGEDFIRDIPNGNKVYKIIKR